VLTNIFLKLWRGSLLAARRPVIRLLVFKVAKEQRVDPHFEDRHEGRSGEPCAQEDQHGRHDDIVDIWLRDWE
jgi:hypothetical protein